MVAVVQRYVYSLIMGTFGVLPMVPMVILPLVTLATIGCHWYHWQSENSKRILAAIGNVSAGCKGRSSFATALLQKQIDPRVPIHNIFAI